MTKNTSHNIGIIHYFIITYIKTLTVLRRLAAAIETGELEIIRACAAEGVDLNAPVKLDLPGLHYATNRRTIHVLFKLGANVNCVRVSNA